MSILFLALGATAAGFLLILLIGRGQPFSPAAPENAPRQDPADLAWVRTLGVEGFHRLLVRLFAEMGFVPEHSEPGRETVDFCAVDPTPIRGGRIYVHGVFARAAGLAVGADDVRALVDAARAEFAGKAVLVTLGRFSNEACDAARENPIDLVDGDELAALMKRHLPQAWATRTL
ncbi:MAG TPA: restriction endonuclease [Gemmatimonadales bacterium]|nr:restriction endonuclease [Gemmatimonadales bacterium]